MYGFLNLNKPAGLTSHDCVDRVRKLLRMKRIGHGGTLDPAAVGVLPIAVGYATRLLQFLRHDKTYQATIRLGMKTTTDDLEGDVLASSPVPWLTLDQVESHLPKFQGVIQQVPPSYSAIQVGGKRLYELARAGEVVEAPVRTVEIYGIKVLNWRSGDFPELDVTIACGGGTYIRSIARDLGETLGVGGTLAHLIRTSSSGFNLDSSLSLEALAEQVEAGAFQPIPPQIALQHLTPITLSADQVKCWQNGQRLLWQDISSMSPPDEEAGFYRVQDETDQFLGIGHPQRMNDDLRLVPKLVWKPDAT